MHFRSRLAHLRRRVVGGQPPVDLNEFRWRGAESEAHAVGALAGWAQDACAVAGTWVLSVGDGSGFHQRLNSALLALRVKYRAMAMAELDAFSPSDDTGLTAVLSGYSDSAQMTELVRRLTTHPVLHDIRFEYAAGLDPQRDVFGRLDEYADTSFVSPVLLDSPTPYEIYEESLTRFEQKCGLRDFLDLYQWLKTIVENAIAGDVAEFGSYKGHSGYLIARTLETLGTDKRLFMFDTFDAFPAEPLGVDHFWSETHDVSFEEVRSKVEHLANVTIVRGDFTETLASTPLGPLALAYIDCDSYRATRFLLDALVPDGIARGGALICEDYGHPALLGNRAAIHESLDGHTGLLRFFSQFSGLYVVVRLP